MNPEISIIIPARNEECFIERTINSILNNNYPKANYEILVIDSMSSDKTKEIVKKLQKKHKNIFLFENKKKITPCAFNIGIKNSKGKFIAIISGHAELEKNYLKNCISCIKKINADCVGGLQTSIGKTEKGKAIANIMNSHFGGSEFHYSKKDKYVSTVYMGFYKKAVFSKLGLFDEEFIRSQDAELNYRLVSKDGKIFLRNKIKSKYYCRETILGLAKQFYGYGFYKMLVYKKYPQFLTYKQLAPLFLILTLIFSIFLHKLSPLLVIYLLFIFISSLFISKTISNFFYSLLILPTMHISYGIGSLMSILTGKIFKI